MKTIKRLIPREDFKLYNIPENFGEMAEMTISPVKSKSSEHKLSSLNVTKLQEVSGMMQMLNEPEEDIWDKL